MDLIDNPAARSRAGGLVAVAALVVLLTGCQPEPLPTDEPTLEPSPTPSMSESLPAEPEEIALPGDCGEVFDEAFTADMESANLPLNDPGLTMPSAELPGALDLLETVPALRCTWGTPSEVGIATTVALVTPEQASALLTEAQANEFACAAATDAETRCTFLLEGGDDEFGTFRQGGEYVLRDNVWIATQWLNVEIPEYADHAVAMIWD
ncbi:hypothetical protein [Microbacterium sp. NIBRBAC000506063]|uniref:hypothetical protein n=1 Tax=Microbacterium sp. NIBRBAC000506063 TaxID=2734618 RepID=UPI001BB4CE32|nr:hypothetical protein [Microbacterium sp. NIBRBAC000506063]QTV79545.1 hypothetical protein KAE78_11815 [Microbacterium sp. NIBRBAC000506063]